MYAKSITFVLELNILPPEKYIPHKIHFSISKKEKKLKKTNMGLQLYQTSLFLAGGINLMIAFVLVYNNFWFSNYTVYHRARVLTALNYTIFAIGFLLHGYFSWRITWPAAASTLTASYFHCGGVLFGWSHTSLMRPDYLTKQVVIRDLSILVVGLITYWTVMDDRTFLIFFLHAAYITYTFYYTYFTTRKNIVRMPTNDRSPRWWTMETKRTVLNSHHSFVISCHLIVLFGLGSIALTAAFPQSIWPYIFLTTAGSAVFCYIFYSITEYGNIIESATFATEDATKW